ncbi:MULTISPECIES: acyl carrier protein [Streptomyces]|uniref:Acyl carrier protein n=1 Tax=Streptomyces lonegramiae TaxID=3075524 RepID=A0ABU2X9I3_9ACTN|nr:acyl carrier protein [Streptomyces sp. DSM 41529]MDT0542570.1 acyl carrier protein [Streptomyces sp. DSM 41529]
MTIADLTEEEALRIVAKAAAEVDARLAERKFTTADDIGEIGLDSVATLELIVSIEDQTGLSFDDDVLFGVNTVGDVVELIRSGTPAVREG